MYTIRADKYYIAEEVFDNPFLWERLSRLDVDAGDPIIIPHEDILGIAKGIPSREEVCGRKKDMVLIADVTDWAGDNPFVGPFDVRKRVSMHDTHGVVCQDGFGFHTAYGCIFRCDFCCYGSVLHLRLDIEEIASRFLRTLPKPSLVKWDNRSDTLCFEPEMGASKYLVEKFADSEHYLMLYTKSDNVAHLLGLEHNGHTVCCWSLAGETQSKHIELRTAPVNKRIAAAKKCADAGYPVRFRFSPICPVINWRKEAERVISDLFNAVQPERITLKALAFMRNTEIFDRMMEKSIKYLDDTFVDAIYRMADEADGYRWGCMPHDQREELYRFYIETIRKHDSAIPVTICLETPEMWDRLSDLLPYDRNNYPCCCAATSIPESLNENVPLHRQMAAAT